MKNHKVRLFFSRAYFDQRGFSIVEVMVAFGLLAVFMYAMMGTFQLFNRQSSFQQQKIDSLQSQSLIVSQIINNISNCTLSIQNKPFNVSSPPSSLELSELVLGPASNISALVRTSRSSYKTGSLVNSINITDIVTDGTIGYYKGNLEVDFKNNIMQTKKMSAPVLFKASAASNLTTGCRTPNSPTNITVLSLGSSQLYPAGSCPAGWMISPMLTMQRNDCTTGDVWVGVSIPNIDGALMFNQDVEFGSSKGGSRGHGWDYFIRGLSNRYYVSPFMLDPSVDHTIKLEFYIGNRGTNFSASSAAFKVFMPADASTVHPCIRLVETTMTIECLR